MHSVTRSPVLQRGLRLIGAVMIVAAPYLPGLGNDHAQAENQLFPNPVPRSENTSKGVLPAKEAVQAIYQDLIEFNIGSDHYRWSATNASHNINPPNVLVIPTGTNRVEKNSVWLDAKKFQPLQSLYNDLYSGILTSIAIMGMAVDIQLDRYYLGTATSRPLSNIWDVYLETGIGVATAENYTGRQRIYKGLPTGGFSGNFTQYITVGRDDRGNWLNMMFDHCINPAENGTYQIRKDDSGNIIGDTFVKLSNSIVPGKPYQVALPAILKIIK